MISRSREIFENGTSFRDRLSAVFFVTVRPLSRGDPIPLMRPPCFELLPLLPSSHWKVFTGEIPGGTGAPPPKVKSLVKRPIGSAFGESKGVGDIERPLLRKSGGIGGFCFRAPLWFLFFSLSLMGGMRIEGRNGTKCAFRGRVALINS